MVRKYTPPPAKQPAQLSAGDMQAALPKLRRRLEEVEAFDPTSIRKEYDHLAEAINTKVQATLVDIFGSETLDYERYGSRTLYAGPLVIGGIPRHEAIEGYRDGKDRVATKIKTAISMIEEKLLDMGTLGGPTGSPLSLLGVDLHPAIEQAAGSLYRDAHYASAIENACKALNKLVQIKSGTSTLSEKTLMQTVFSRNKPRLAFNDLLDETDFSEQEGMMHIYAGVFLAFRNPRAHKLVDDDAATAFGIISMVSFLVGLLEKAKVRPTN